MPFVSGPVLRYVGAGQYCTVGHTDYVGADDLIVVPSDFPTDLATVPRIFWAALPPHGAYERSAVLHDYLCTRLADQARSGDPAPVSSRDADGLFRRVMRESGVGFVTRWVMWCGVRLGALANPARRDGWLRDAPAVLAISAAVLAVTVGVIIVTDRVAHLILEAL